MKGDLKSVDQSGGPVLVGVDHIDTPDGDEAELAVTPGGLDANFLEFPFFRHSIRPRSSHQPKESRMATN
jgi:hypothetical protein